MVIGFVQTLVLLQNFTNREPVGEFGHSALEVALMYDAGINAVLLEITILVTSLPKWKLSICLPAVAEAEAVAANPPAGAVGGGVEAIPPTGTQVAPELEPDSWYPALQLAAPHVGKELYAAAFDTAEHRLVHWVVADGVTVYVPAAVGAVAYEVPGIVFSAHTSVVPPLLNWIDFTELFDEPTLNVPGLVTVNVPLENNQLCAVEPFSMSMSAVPEPKVTPVTVMFPFAVKSVVAATAITGRNNANEIISKIFFIM